MKGKKYIRWDLWIAGTPALIGLLILFIFWGMTWSSHEPTTDFDYKATQTIGTFIGGVVPVFLSMSTIILIYLTYSHNRKELKEFNSFNNLQHKSETLNLLFDTIKDMIISYNDTINWYSDVNNLNQSTGRILERAVRNANPNAIVPELDYSPHIRDVLINHNYLGASEPQKTQLKRLNSAIIMIYKYLDESPEVLKNVYKFKYDQLISGSNIRKVISLNGFVDNELKEVINKNSLLRNDNKIFPMRTRNAIGNVAFIYNFNLGSFYDETAFREVE